MSESYYGTVPTGFTVVRTASRSVVRQFPDRDWYHFFGDGCPSEFRRLIDAMVKGREYRAPWDTQFIVKHPRVFWYP